MIIFGTEKLKYSHGFTKNYSLDIENWDQMKDAIVETAKETIILAKPKKTHLVELEV